MMRISAVLILTAAPGRIGCKDGAEPVATITNALAALQLGDGMVIVATPPQSAILGAQLARLSAAQGNAARLVILAPQAGGAPAPADRIGLRSILLGVAAPTAIAADVGLGRATGQALLPLRLGTRLTADGVAALRAALAGSDARAAVGSQQALLTGGMLLRATALADLGRLPTHEEGQTSVALAILAMAHDWAPIQVPLGDAAPTRPKPTVVEALADYALRSRVIEAGTPPAGLQDLVWTTFLNDLTMSFTQLEPEDCWAAVHAIAGVIHSGADEGPRKMSANATEQALMAVRNQPLWQVALAWQGARILDKMPGADREAVVCAARAAWAAAGSRSLAFTRPS